MAGGSSRLYMQRKHVKPAAAAVAPQFRADTLQYNDRPHVTIPELVEHYPNVYVPPVPSSSSSSTTPTDDILTWDVGEKWDSGLKWK